MKLETFFEKFDQFADAPGAVAKMRELVLRLAMQGKLVPQNPSEVPAETLIQELMAEAHDKTARRAETLPPIAPDDIPFQLPAGWVWARLGNIGKTNIGLTYSPQDVSDFGTPVLRSSNVQNGRLDFADLVRVRCEPKQSVMVQDGDLLICVRNGSRALVGKVALIENLKEPSAFGAFMAIFRSRVNPFLFHFICSPLFRRMIDDVNTTTINQITQSNLRSTLAPIPPLAEQKRIVAKVDELMALCDRLEAQQQAREEQSSQLAHASLARFATAPTPANLNYLFHPSYNISPADLRKSILTLAVQGKLVPQNPNDEPAEESFSKLAPLAVKSGMGHVPAKWLCMPLGSMGEWRGGGTPSKSRPEFWKGDLPWVSPKDMKVLYITDAQDHISQAAVAASSARLIPAGSFLMVVRGMILARAFPVAIAMREVTINQDMKALVPTDARVSDYLLVALRALEPYVLAAIEHSSHGTCKLKTEFLQDFVIPIPPLAEQRRIVAKVSQLMTLVDELETHLTTARTNAQNLLSALITELTRK
ncbi:MAG: restriction endonuclease subunit S [Planctomycetaceae bacterium]|nr:restriction endonuclease subunit S [Planctomycetaceae bacterium]